MPGSAAAISNLKKILASAARLRAHAFPDTEINPLLNLSAVIVFRHAMGLDRPPVIGLVGCTGVGKSTLFNSLAGASVSTTGWKTHNTCGPIVIAPSRLKQQLNQEEQQNGLLLMPSFQRAETILSPADNSTDTTTTVGAPDLLHLFWTPQDRTTRLPATSNDQILVDLPDINSSRAISEGSVALKVLPWLDTVVFMVDDETLYHRVYRQSVEETGLLQTNRLCALVNRGRDRIDSSHPDWQDSLAFFGVDQIHVLPKLKNGIHYLDEPAYLELKHQLCQQSHPSNDSLIQKKIAAHAKIICEHNQKRSRVFSALERRITQEVHHILAHPLPIRLGTILPDDTLHQLEHLGLKRFALSNVLHFLKRLTLTGTLKRSIAQTWSHRKKDILQLDRNKLLAEVTNRLVDSGERISIRVRSDRNYDTICRIISAPSVRNGLNALSFPEEQTVLLQRELDTVVNDFEGQCRQLLSSDTLGKAALNDPLTLLSVLTVLLADVTVIPGFGSWLLVPTVFKYLPIGKFESLKNTFVTAVNDIIRNQLLQSTSAIWAHHRQFLLDGQDPLLNSLQSLSQTNEKN